MTNRSCEYDENTDLGRQSSSDLRNGRTSSTIEVGEEIPPSEEIPSVKMEGMG